MEQQERNNERCFVLYFTVTCMIQVLKVQGLCFAMVPCQISYTPACDMTSISYARAGSSPETILPACSTYSDQRACFNWLCLWQPAIVHNECYCT